MSYIIHPTRPRPFHFSGFPLRTRRRAEKAVCGEASDAKCFSILCSCQSNHGFQPFLRDQSIHVFQSYYVRLTNLRRFCSSALGAVTRTPSWFLNKGQNMGNNQMIRTQMIISSRYSFNAIFLHTWSCRWFPQYRELRHCSLPSQ